MNSILDTPGYKAVKGEMVQKEQETNLAIAGVNAELMAKYARNAQKGSEDLSVGGMPQLKITEALSKNEYGNGQRATAGTLYYAPTREVFGTDLDVCITRVSRGFYAKDNSEVPKAAFTQLVGGVMLESHQLFVMFISGSRLNNLWDFANEIKPFTKNKQMPIPMYAFKVNLNTEFTEVKKGRDTFEFHLLNFDLKKNPEGQYMIVDDNDFENILEKSVDVFKEIFTDWILKNEVDKDTLKPIHQGSEVQYVQESRRPIEAVETENLEKAVEDAFVPPNDIDPDVIPF